jgi:hypothetical protein
MILSTSKSILETMFFTAPQKYPYTTDPNDQYLTLKTPNKVTVGYIRYHTHSSGEARVLEIEVAPTFQGQGYSKSLLTHLQTIYRKVSFNGAVFTPTGAARLHTTTPQVRVTIPRDLRFYDFVKDRPYPVPRGLQGS